MGVVKHHNIKMEGLTLKFFISATLLVFVNGFEIDIHTEDQQVNVGESFEVSCHVTGGFVENHDWKHCVWTREADQASCTFTYLKPEDGDWKVDKNCSTPLADISFSGDDPTDKNTLCGLNIDSADALDNGNWQCSIEQCQTNGNPFGQDGCREVDGVGSYINALMNVEVISQETTEAETTAQEETTPDATTQEATTPEVETTPEITTAVETTPEVETTQEVTTEEETTPDVVTTEEPETTTGNDDGGPCDDFRCYNGGYCREGPRLPDGAECVCPEEYDGEFCQYLNVCDDAENPKDCSGNGICENDDTDDGYSCYREPGFTGDDCEEDDPCYPNPCLHDGICMPCDEEGCKHEIECDCQEGYYGDFCGTADPCRKITCLNGGNCEVITDDDDVHPECDCAPGYEGEFCEAEIVCNPPCMNGGVCDKDHNDDLVCFCPPGYSGIQCEHNICVPNPCYNGGTCNIKHGKVECDCPKGYNGTHCEENDCLNYNCNHGNCFINKDGEVQCDCKDDWEGPDCDIPKSILNFYVKYYDAMDEKRP